MCIIRPITTEDDAELAKIIRTCLESYHLNIPGTAYFDPQLDHLSRFYQEKPGRAYLVATDEAGHLLGGVGVAEFDGMASCAEMQKLYLSEAARGKGLGKKLVAQAETFAKEAGYHSLYLETHSVLQTAIHLYEKLGFQQIEKPQAVQHSTMDSFYLKTF